MQQKSTIFKNLINAKGNVNYMYAYHDAVNLEKNHWIIHRPGKKNENLLDEILI